MVAVFTGNDLGLFRSSLSQLGMTLGGKAGLGQSRESQYVNVANGNLVLQGADEQLTWQGLNVGMLRTYNSQGQLTGANGTATDGFETGFERRVELTNKSIGQSGSQVTLWTGDGQKVVFTYVNNNAAGQPVYQSTDGSGAHDTLTWDGTNKIWTWVEGSTRQTQTFADHASATLLGRLLSISDGKSGAKFTVSYDSNGRVSEVAAGNGDALVYNYDASGRLSALGTREAGTLKGQVYYDYDSAGRLSKITTDLDPNTNINRANIADGKVFWTQYTYVNATSLQVAKVEQSDGVVASYTYDASNRVKTVTSGDVNTNDVDGAGQTLTFTYGGTLTDGGTTYTSTQVVDSAGRAWTYAYDASGQLRVVKAPAVNGQSGLNHYAYDASGNLTQITDAQGGVTTYTYDASGNLLQQSTQGGARVDRTYNTANQVVCETRYPQTDANGNSTTSVAETRRYVYDAGNRLRFVVDAAGDVTEYRYAVVGTSGVQQLASTLTYLGGNYNLAGLTATQALTESQLTSWGSGQDMGQVTRVDFSYDVRGAMYERRAFATVDAQGNGVSDSGLEIVRYTYDAQGLLRQQAEVRGANRDLLEGTSFLYDGMGRLVSTTDALQHTTTRLYDDANHRLVVTQVATGLVQTQAYDRVGQVIAITESAVSTSEVHTSQWFYDAEGQLRATQDASGARAYRFYDAAGRLQGEVDATGAVMEYRRNLNGDVTETIGYAARVDTTSWLSNGLVTPTSLAAILPTTSADDRHAQSTYDAAGRLATQVDAVNTTTTYSYDGENRLIQVRVAGTGGATRVTRTFYDVAGRQVGILDAEGYLTEFMYDRANRQVGSVRYATATNTSLRATGSLSQLRPTASSVADVRTREFYDGRGNVIAALDAEGYLTESVIDEVGHTRETRAYAKQLTGLTGNESLATLHATAVTGAVRITRMAYDALGQLITQINPEGTYTTYSYDAVGHLVRTDTAANASDVRENNQRFDVFGNLIGELGGEGSIHLMPGITEAQLDAIYNQYGVTHRYDAVGRRIESTDANGNKTWYVYDAAGRQTFQVRGVADANGVPNGAGEVTETRYNAFGQIQDSIAYTGRITITTPGDRVSVLQAVSTLQYVAALDSRQRFEYNTRGLLAKSTDGLGRSTVIQYDVFGEQSVVSDYDQTGDRVNPERQFTYDRLGRLTRTEEVSVDSMLVDGMPVEFRLFLRSSLQGWDAFNRISVTDGNGVTTTYAYDRLGRQVTSSRTVSDRLEQVSVVYDAYGRVTSQFDAAHNETKFLYDDAAKSVTVTSPEGVTVTTVHDAFGQTVTVTDGLNEVTSYEYDHDGHLVSTRDATQTGTLAGTHDEYDARGLLHRTTDATGRIVELNYDAAGRVLTRAVDPAGLNLVTSYVYDGQGRQIQVTDPSGVVTQMKYDVAGQLIETAVDPLGLALKTTYTWDGLGRQLSVTEGAGTAGAHTVAYAYDELGRRISETVDPNGLALTTNYTYDANDNVISRSDAAGRVTTYLYDDANRLIQKVDGDHGVVWMTYDIKGQLIATRSYANRMVPDADGTLLVSDNAHDLQAYRVYDRDGRMRYTVDGAGAVCEYSYDAANRLIQTRHYATAIDINAARAGLQSGSITPAVTADGAHDEITSQVYDAAGRVRFTVDAVGGVTESRYDAAGRVVETVAHATALVMSDALRAQLKAGMTDTVMTQLVDAVAGDTRAQSYVYDGAGRRAYSVTRATVLGVASAGVVMGTQYDAAGRVLAQTSYGVALPAYQVFQSQGDLQNALAAAGANGSAATQRTSQMRYDGAGQLRFTIDAMGAVTESVYDAAGEVVASKQYGALLSGAGSTANVAAWAAAQSNVRTTQFQYDNAGRLLHKIDALNNAESWTYDGSGLKLSYTNRNNQIWTYQYDGAGRQTAEISPEVVVTTVDENGQITQVSRSIVTRMAYDGLGNLTSKSEDADGDVPRTTEYGYDNRGHQILTCFPDAGQLEDGSTNLQYTDNRPTIQVAYDTLGRAVVETDVQGNYRHRAYDAAGQLSYEVDQEGGVTGYTYNAFGEQTSLTRYATPLATIDGVPLTSVAVTTSNDDRTLTSVYDLGGRKIEIRQSGVAWYDGEGNTGISSPTMRYLYDAFGQLVKESVLQSGDPAQSNANWADTLHYYDAAGRQIATVDAEGYFTRMEYDAQGELIKQTEFVAGLWEAFVGVLPDDPPTSNDRSIGFDRITQFQYDALGRKVAETSSRHDWSDEGMSGTAVDVTTTIDYDNEGHAVSTTVGGVTTQTSYDALGHVQSVTEQSRQVLAADAQAQIAANHDLRLSDASLYQIVSPYTTMAYDAFGNVVQVRRYANGLEGGSSASDQVHTTCYDWQGRAVWERDEAGTIYMRVYDAADHITESRFRLDGNNGRWADVVTTATYDRTGRQLSSIVHRDMHLTGTGAAIVSGTDASSFVRYNAFGEIISKADTQSGLGTTDQSLLYTYDAAGRMVQSNEGHTSHLYGYDLAGNQTREEHQVALSGAFGDGLRHQSIVTLQSFDYMGRIIGQTIPIADDGTGQAELQRSYDRWGNVVEEVGANNAVTTYYYNELNQVIYERKPEVTTLGDNGVRYLEAPVTVYGYDALGRLVRTMGPRGGWHVNTFDNVGQVVASQNATYNVSHAAFNALGQEVLDEDPTGYVTFKTYDIAGRVTAQGDFTTNGVGARARNVRESYALNQDGNRLRVTDALGNTAFYDYDSRGLVLRSRTAAGVIMDYAYDVQGHKTRETNALSDSSLLADNAPALVSNGSLLSYVAVPIGRAWSLAIQHDVFDAGWGQGYTITANIEQAEYGTAVFTSSTDLAYDAQSGMLSGTPQNRYYRVTFTATDAEGHQATAVMTIAGEAATQYDAAHLPIPVHGIKTISGGMGQAIDVVLPSDAFVDAAGRQLTYEIHVVESRWVDNGTNGTMAPTLMQQQEPGGGYEDVEVPLDESDLGRYLTFNATTMHLSGTLPPAGTYTYYLIAIDPDGHQLSQSCDINVSAKQAGTRTQVSTDGGNPVYRDEQTWSYDIFGRLQNHHDLSGAKYNYQYDGVTGQLLTQGSDWTTQTTTSSVYDYIDEYDTLFWAKYGGTPDPLQGVTLTQTTVYDREIEYYANGQIKAIRENNNYTQYTYDVSGNRTSEETLTHDNNNNQTHLRTTMQYDAQNRLVRVTQTDLNANKGLLDLRYEYDSAGNRVHVMARGGYGATQAPVVTSDLPPVVITPLPDAHLAIGEEWSWSIPSDSFEDPEGGPLRFDVDVADGDWPDWLDYDSTTGTFSGTPTADTTVTIRVTVTDLDGKSVFDDFVITAAENQSPQVLTSIPRQTATVGQAWTFGVANAFVDPEGEPLHFTGTLIESSALPSWLSFDPDTGVFTGTPPTGSDGYMVLELYAFDPHGASSVRVRFTVDIVLPTFSGFTNLDFNGASSTDNWNPTSSGPIVAQHVGYIGTGAYPGTVTITQGGKRPISDGQQVSVGVQFEFHGYNSSTQGHGVAGEYASGSIVWYDAAGNEIGTTAGNTLNGAAGYVGLTQFAVTGNAPTGAAYYSMRFSTAFSISSAQILIDNAFYVDPNGSGGAVPASFTAPPVLNRPIADQTIASGTNWSFQLPVDTFTDADTPVLSYSAQQGYTPAPAAPMTMMLVIDPGDGGGDGGSGGGPTYEALPSWLTFDAVTRTFSGLASTAQTLTIMVTASDGTNSAMTQFTLTVSDTQVNQPPHANGSIPAQTTTTGQAWSYALPAGIITDPEGQALTWVAVAQGGGALPSWLSFDPATQTFTGTPPADGATTITVTATDPQGASASLDFTITAQAHVNQAPVANGNVPGQVATVGQAWSYVLPAGIVTDPEGEVLIWTAALQGGGVLPSWLSFDPATQTFSGTPDAAGNYTVVVTATDPEGAAASVQFAITADTTTLTAPQMLSGIGTRYAVAGMAFSYQVPRDAFVGPYGHPLHYAAQSADGSPLPGWLSFDPYSLTLSGTPSGVGNTSVKVVATDDFGRSVSQTFAINARASDGDAITASTDFPTVTLTAGQPWSYVLPTDLFSVPNGGINYSFALSEATSTPVGDLTDLRSVAMPYWMHFDEPTRTLSGTPPVGGGFVMYVWATDDAYQNHDIFSAINVNILNSDGSQPTTQPAPQTLRSLPAISVTEGQQLSWAIPNDLFSHQSDGYLNYSIGFSSSTPSAFGTNGQLPSWLTYDPINRIISGIPPVGSAGATFNIWISADNGHEVAETSFGMTVNAASAGTTTNTFRTTYTRQQLRPAPMKLMAPPDDGWDTGPGVGGGGGSGSPPTPNDPITNANGWQDFWYSYDAENRLQVAHGKLENGQVVLADNTVSFELTYDEAGRAKERITRVQGGTPDQIAFETTNYDERGNRTSLVQSGALTESFSYDALGRQTNHGTYDAGGAIKHLDVMVYDADGRVTRQTSYGHTQQAIQANYAEGMGLQGLSQVIYYPYDAAGRMTGYSYNAISNETGVADPNAPTGFFQFFAYNYEGRESYLEKSIAGSSSNQNFKASTSTSTYDAWGRRVAVSEYTPGMSNTRTRLFAYDMEGNILQRMDDQGTERYAYVQGQNVASGQSSGKLDVISQLTGYQTSDAGTTTAQVQAGDTLRGIAQRVYGNSNLWYVLAEANAISSDSELVAGTTLKVPQIEVTKNDATTFKPFSPNDAIGNTAPSLPYIQPPPKHHCNVVAMVLIIVVAIVVTYFTWGAASGAMTAGVNAAAGTAAAGGAAAGTVVSTGLATTAVGAAAGAATLSTTGAFVAGFAAGAAGSIASQVVGSALGVTKFSWKQVLVDGFVNGVTMGVGKALTASGNAAFEAGGELTSTGRAVQAVAGYGGSVVANSIVGRPSNFSWKAVAATIAGSYLSSAAGGRVSMLQGGPQGGGFMDNLVGNFIDGASKATARRMMGLGKQDWGQIAVDAFGNALGNAIVGGIRVASSGRGLDGSTKDAYRNLVDNGIDPEVARATVTNSSVQSMLATRDAMNGAAMDRYGKSFNDLSADQQAIILSSQKTGEYTLNRSGIAQEYFPENTASSNAAEANNGSVPVIDVVGGRTEKIGLKWYAEAASEVIVKTELAFGDAVQTLGEDNVRAITLATQFAVGGIPKTLVSLAFQNSPAGEWVGEKLNTYFKQPLSEGYANGLGARSEAEISSVRPATDLAATFTIGLAGTAIGLGAKPGLDLMIGAARTARATLASSTARLEATFRQFLKDAREVDIAAASGAGGQFSNQAGHIDVRSPNTAFRNAANESGEYVDPLTNERVPYDGRLPADHRIPQNWIKSRPGFSDLTAEQQSAILNDPMNAFPLPATFNSSKGAKLPSEWTHYKGQELHPDYRAAMGQQETQLMDSIDKQIQDYLLKNGGR